MSRPYITIGDTLLINGTYRDSNGDLVDLDAAGITIEAWVKDPTGLSKTDLSVTLKSQATNPGEFQIVSQTDEWEGLPGIWQFTASYVSSIGRFSDRPVELELRG